MSRCSRPATAPRRHRPEAHATVDFALGGFPAGAGVPLRARRRLPVPRAVDPRGRIGGRRRADADVDEPPTRAMHMLREPIPIEESRNWRVGLAEPVWEAVAAVGERSGRSADALNALANADPAGTLEKLESASFGNMIWDVPAPDRDRRGDGGRGSGGGGGGGRVDRRSWPACRRTVQAGQRPARRPTRSEARPARPRGGRRPGRARCGPATRAARRPGRSPSTAGRRRDGPGALRRGRAARRPDAGQEQRERAYFAAQLAAVDPEAALAIARDFKGVRVGGSSRVVFGLQIIARAMPPTACSSGGKRRISRRSPPTNR